MNNVIEQKRMEIDLIDADIIHLLNKRYDACLAIGEAKKQEGSAVFNPSREFNIIKRLEKSEKYSGTVAAIWPTIMAFSRQLQRSV